MKLTNRSVLLIASYWKVKIDEIIILKFQYKLNKKLTFNFSVQSPKDRWFEQNCKTKYFTDEIYAKGILVKETRD